jgi:uncharacterized protein YjbJ (UPF0337 family)
MEGLITVLKEEKEMAEKVDKAKGRAKKAAGEVTDSGSLKRKGQVDKASGKTKEKVGGAADKAKKAL